MQILTTDGPFPAALLAEHVAPPHTRPEGRALVRLNMITSVDGSSAVAGVSGGLGNENDRAVFAGLRGKADVVVVGMSTAVAEQYAVPPDDGPELYVCQTHPDVTGAEWLFESDRVALVVPEDAGDAPGHIRTVRAGRGEVDPGALVAQLAGRLVLLEGGPRLAGAFAASGVLDEMFVTIAPRVIAGDAARIVHGDAAADPAPWHLAHGVLDDAGFLFLRYERAAS